jgi:hypothetical protein
MIYSVNYIENDSRLLYCRELSMRPRQLPDFHIGDVRKNVGIVLPFRSCAAVVCILLNLATNLGLGSNTSAQVGACTVPRTLFREPRMSYA